MSKNKLNISPIVSPDILKTISAVTAIKTFGAQLKDKSKETVIIGNQTKTADIQAEKDKLIKESESLGEKESADIEKASNDFNTNQITQQEYDDKVALIQSSTIAKKEIIDLQLAKLTQDQQNIDNNPNNILNNQQSLFNKNIQNLKKKTQSSENKSKRNLTKQVLSNAVKSLAPIIGLQLANQFKNIISQRKKLEELVDQINNYIDTQVKDEQTVIIATNLRNNAITLINNSIKKLDNLEKILKTIQSIITVFALILSVISLIPVPVPPKVVITLEKANKLVLALSALLAIATSLLTNEIAKLNELIERLKQISLKLDGKSLDNLNALSNLFLPTGLDYPPYKGFNFKIKEEQNQKFVVKGNKRRYAVAINSDGIEQLKSEFSFTLDPNDLIEQLKLVIDQRNLQG